MHRVIDIISFVLHQLYLKPTKRSKYMHSPLLYNERDIFPIQYTKNIAGMASLVDAIRALHFLNLS